MTSRADRAQSRAHRRVPDENLHEWYTPALLGGGGAAQSWTPSWLSPSLTAPTCHLGQTQSELQTPAVGRLSDSTVRQIYTVLRADPDGAVHDGLIARNPAAQVTRPGVARREARHLDADSVAAVLRAAKSSRYHAALVLIASTVAVSVWRWRGIESTWTPACCGWRRPSQGWPAGW